MSHFSISISKSRRAHPLKQEWEDLSAASPSTAQSLSASPSTAQSLSASMLARGRVDRQCRNRRTWLRPLPHFECVDFDVDELMRGQSAQRRTGLAAASIPAARNADFDIDGMGASTANAGMGGPGGSVAPHCEEFADVDIEDFAQGLPTQKWEDAVAASPAPTSPFHRIGRFRH